MADNKMRYAKMTQASVDPRFGKLAPGRIVPLDEETYDRWNGVGIIEASSQKAYEDAQEKRASAGGGGDRGTKLRELAAEKSAMWDTATHRDAMTAPPEGLKKAMDAGVPLVNLDRLRDESGVSLQSDSSVDQIVEARSRLAERDPLREHTQSSVSGGGSHYFTPAPLNQKELSVENLAKGNLDPTQERPKAKDSKAK